MGLELYVQNMSRNTVVQMTPAVFPPRLTIKHAEAEVGTVGVLRKDILRDAEKVASWATPEASDVESWPLKEEAKLGDIRNRPVYQVRVAGRVREHVREAGRGVI